MASDYSVPRHYLYQRWHLSFGYKFSKMLADPTLNFLQNWSNLSNSSISWMQLSCAALTIADGGQVI